MEDEIELFDEDVVSENGPPRQNLKRLHRIQTREEAVLGQFEFMEPDQNLASSGEKDKCERVETDLDDKFIAVDEAGDHDADTIRKKVKEAMDIGEQGPSLVDAFRLLSNSDADEFLNSEVIQHLFRVVYLVLGEFGQGGYAKNMVWLFRRFFRSAVTVNRRKSSHKDRCMACGCSRETSFEFLTTTNRSLGIMGPDCYNIKMVHIMKLAEDCLMLASCFEAYEAEEFAEFAHRVLTSALDPIIESSQKMKERYADTFPGTNIKKCRVPSQKTRKSAYRSLQIREQPIPVKRLKLIDLTGEEPVFEYY